MSKKEISTRRFHLSDVARGYFEKIGVSSGRERKKGKSKSGMFNSYIQPYYLCIQIGMIKDQRRDPDTLSVDMVNYWTSSAIKYEDLIAGVGFYYYCQRNGIMEEDERSLKLMSSFFTKDRDYIYGVEGYTMLNKYAQGGFDYIRENYGEASDLADFLIWYMEEIET